MPDAIPAANCLRSIGPADCELRSSARINSSHSTTDNHQKGTETHLLAKSGQANEGWLDRVV